MIPRYSRPEMAAIWSPETKFRIWFEIEAHAADAMAELGVIPKEAARTIRDKGEARRCSTSPASTRSSARSSTTSSPS
jgi:adenylosuccinate lyase